MRHRAACVGALLCATTVWGAELPEAWRHWSSFRPIDPPPQSAGRLVGVAVPAEVLGAARGDLADLRIVDEAGREVPFVLHARFGRSVRDWRATTLSDTGFVPGAYTQAVIDTGGDGRPHNALELDLAATDFFAWTEVAASDDRETWRVVRARGPLYRFEKDGLEGTRKITYAETTARWLRLRLQFGEQDLTVRSVRVAQEIVRPPELVALPVELRRVADPPAGQSRWEAHLDAPLAASAVRLATAREAFHRPAEVSAGDAAAHLQRVASGEVYRYPPAESGSAQADADRERLQVDFAEARGRHFRVTVYDRSDPPVEDLRPQLLFVPRRVVFRPEPGVSYRLLYGNTKADAPTYELARLTTTEELEAALPARVGAEGSNDAYVSPEPWTEGHPVVLWAALGLAILALAVLAFRSLR